MDFFACPLMLLRSNATNGNRPMAIKVRNCTLTRPPWTGHLPTGRGLWTAPAGCVACPPLLDARLRPDALRLPNSH